MNEFELSYSHQVRSRELIAAAERSRMVREARSFDRANKPAKKLLAGFLARKRAAGVPPGRSAHAAK